MSLCFFLKLLSEFSLYFVAANAILSIGMVGVESLFPMLLCAGIGTFARWMDEKWTDGRWKNSRLFPLLLLLAVFFFADGFGTALAVALPALYTVLLIFSRRYYIDHATQADFFRIGTYLVVVLVVIFGFLIGLTYVIPFALLFFLSSILLLRSLRQDSDIQKEKRYRLLNLLSIALLILLDLVLGSDTALRLLQQAAQAVYTLAISPVLYVLAYLVASTAVGFARLVAFLFPNYELDMDGMKYLMDSMNAAQPMIEEGYDPGSMSDRLILFARAAVTIGALAALIIFFLRHSRRGKNPDTQAGVREYRSSVTAFRPEEKIPSDRFPPREPRAAVRYYYRSFLRLCANLGHPFPPHYTSKHIENVIADEFDEESLTALRQTYIRARYSGHAVTKEDVSLIKEQVKRMRDSTSQIWK